MRVKHRLVDASKNMLWVMSVGVQCECSASCYVASVDSRIDLNSADTALERFERAFLTWKWLVSVFRIQQERSQSINTAERLQN